MFDFYTRLIPSGDLFRRSVAEAVRLARERFNYQGVCDLNLTLSHRKRVEINRRVNLHKKPADAAFLPCPPAKRLVLNAPQSMWVWPGLDLLGCVPLEKHGIRNGVAYTIDWLDENTVKLEGGIELSHEDSLHMHACREERRTGRCAYTTRRMRT